MRKKIILKVTILIILILLTLLLSIKFLKSLNNHVTVFIANQDIDSHVLITEDMVEAVEIGFEEKVNFFNKAFETKGEIIGKVTLNSVKKGDVFINNDSLLNSLESLEAIDSSGNIDATYFLGDKDRIGFISIEKNRALGGEIRKGDYIDIIFTSMNDNTGGLYSSMLLQKIPVYRVKDNNQSSSILDIHLQMQPQEALLLSLAKYNGQIDLLLTDESIDKSDILPVIPPILYERLIEAGYLLVTDRNEKYEEHTHHNTQESDLSELEKQIQSAEADLEKAFAAMTSAKAALEAERNKVPEETVEEMIRRLEQAVKNLEGAVSQNKTILEDLEFELNTKMKGD